MRAVNLVKILALLLAVDLALMSAYIAVNSMSFDSVGLVLIRSKFAFWLNIHGEGNLISWYSAGKFLLCAVLYLQVFLKGRSISCLILSIVMLLLSADEGAQFHENVGHVLSYLFLDPEDTVGGTHSSHDWPYLYGLLAIGFIAMSLLIIAKLRELESKTIALLVIGFTVLLAGAVGMEVVSHQKSLEVWWFRADLVEELMECVGASILVIASIRLWADSYSAVLPRSESSLLNFSYLMALSASLLIVVASLWVWKYPTVQTINKSSSKVWTGCDLPIFSEASLRGCAAYSNNAGRSLITYGPYVGLGKGRYSLSINYRALSRNLDDVGSWDIVYNGGRTVLKEGTLKSASEGLFETEFELKSSAQDVEVRVYSNGRKAMELMHIALRPI